MDFDDPVDYVKIAKVSDFDRINMKSFRLLARPVGVFKEPDGTFYAMEVGCKHENADLTQGRVQGNIVTCPWHGWRYNLKTGACIHGGELSLRRHGLKIENGFIYITLRPLPDPSASTRES
ncbi:MAG: Rieske (2Fe-2S) protein [Candidatus Hydrogenedentes bacterium]|nr:Rieske (2Fe-2S) protein [Candidatus Hydrogenedentota bacterium]